MFEKILEPSVQRYIRDNERSDLAELVLSSKKILAVDASEIAVQINGRKKAKDKIPTYYHAEGIVYPPAINLEQSSSEATARYKVKLLSAVVGKVGQLLDLTGGFGVDSFFFSREINHVTYLEPNTSLFNIAHHNHEALKASGIRHINEDAERFLEKTHDFFDVVFIDPSRRVEGAKVMTLRDSQPNVVSLQEKIFTHAPWLMVKISPMMDMRLAMQQLKNVTVVVALAVDNEMKELLLVCNRDVGATPKIITDNITGHGIQHFEFTLEEESNLSSVISEPSVFLYEPNVSILKAGAFKSIGHAFDLAKISVNTHYYTSEKLVSDFPGRIFKIEAFVKPDRAAATHFANGKANVTTRNYPLSVEQIKSKTTLTDGGDKFLIGFSGTSRKYLAVASRMK